MPPSRITVEVPLAVTSPNRLHAEHYIARAKRVARERRVITAALDGYERPSEPIPCVVTLTRYGMRPLDSDNWEGAAKATRDAVAAWLRCSDDTKSPIAWVYDQAPAPKGETWVQIDINWQRRGRRRPPKKLRVPDLEEVQALPDEPPIRCVRRILVGATQGEILGRVPHVKPTGSGSELVVAKKLYDGRPYLSIAVYFATFGHIGAATPPVPTQIRPRKGYRTLGVALYSPDELRAVRDACQLMLDELGDP